MSNPVLDVAITTLDEKSARVRAVFDTRAHPTIIRKDRLPRGAAVMSGGLLSVLRIRRYRGRVIDDNDVFCTSIGRLKASAA